MAASKSTFPEENPLPDDNDYQDITDNLVEAPSGGKGNQNEIINYASDIEKHADSSASFGHVGILCTQNLIVTEPLKPSPDVREETTNASCAAENLSESQSSHNVPTVHDKKDLTITFPPGYGIPKDTDSYFIEASILNDPEGNQQNCRKLEARLYHADGYIESDKIHMARLTKENFLTGAMKVGLAVIESQTNCSKQNLSLALINCKANSNLASTDETSKNHDQISNTSHARVALSLVYKMPNGKLVRFPCTTVYLDIPIQKEPIGDVICPRCCHVFNIEEQQKMPRKRTLSAPSTPTKKARRAQ